MSTHQGNQHSAHATAAVDDERGHAESERRSEASASSSSSFSSSWTRGAPEHAPWTPGATPPPAGRTPPSSAPPPSNRQTTARGGSGGRERRQLHLPRWECGSVDAVSRGICSSAATGQRDCRAAPPEVVSSVRVGLRARLAPPPPWLWRRCSVPVGRRAAATPPFSPSVQHCGGVHLLVTRTMGICLCVMTGMATTMKNCNCGITAVCARRHKLLLLVHTRHDAAHQGPANQGENTARGAMSPAKPALYRPCRPSQA